MEINPANSGQPIFDKEGKILNFNKEVYSSRSLKRISLCKSTQILKRALHWQKNTQFRENGMEIGVTWCLPKLMIIIVKKILKNKIGTADVKSQLNLNRRDQRCQKSIKQIYL